MSAELVELPLRFKVYALLEDGRWTLKAGFETDMLAGAWALGVMSHGVQVRIFDGSVEITQELTAKTAEALQGDPVIQEMLKKRNASI